ncbi:glycosyltransferase family 39 protein [Leptolyngbya sp. FACHB-17]|uniref:ArnT family glycosyltransferase n=1 Tax=unclassified Leptolyngbya TaxID=2650499 RepID=UPI0016806EE3|nr:glycosyltransferase family 39 protein [Leptolyngbya sp. FACHB-17]MBD2080107.1 glycosyltransferase family 39 protein [Leptolyngbya sp. FACHB-17]
MKSVQKWWAEPTNRQVAAILIVGFLFRSFIAFWLPPGFDEAYYYIYTQNPALSYFDHPPLVSLVSAIGIWLTGEVSQFTIRIGSLLLYPFTLYFLYRAAVHLFSVRVGLLTLAIASVIPIFQLGFGTFTLPDSPLMFFWTLTLWVGAVEFFPRDRTVYIPSYRVALIGLLVGLACVGKYHGFLLGFGLIGFCLTSRRHWAVFRSPWTILSFLLFLVAFSPVLYWNSQHDWISFTFQGNRSVPNRSFKFSKVIDVAFAASLYLFPTFGLPLWFVSIQEIILTVSRRFSNSIHSFVLWTSAPVFIIFTLIGGYQQILPGWTMPGFFSVTPLLAWYASRWRSSVLKRWLVGSTLAIVALLLFALSHVTLGTLQKPGQYALFGGFVAPQDDPSVDLMDILQLRREFSRSPQLLTALKNADFMFSNRFHMAGHTAMALTPLYSTPMTCFDRRDLRGFAFWSTAEQWLGKTGLYITADKFQTQEDSAAEYVPYFEKFTKLGEVELRRGGVVIDRIHVFQGTNLLKPFPRPY